MGWLAGGCRRRPTYCTVIEIWRGDRNMHFIRLQESDEYRDEQSP